MDKYVPKMYKKNIYNINYLKLKQQGVECLLYDLDNTLISPSSKKITSDLKNFFKTLKQDGFRIIIFSNSPKNRVKPIGDKLEIDFISSAMKPLRYKFDKVIKEGQYNANNVAIIGDQLFTDILGGNKVGIITVLVDPIDKSDILLTKINRLREKKLEKKLAFNNLLVRGRYYE